MNYERTFEDYYMDARMDAYEQGLAKGQELFTPNYAKNCVVDYANKLMDHIIKERNTNPYFDISDILAYIERSKYEYEPAKYIFTGHYDTNGTPIYVGDTIKEGCNGLIRKVVIDYDKNSYWLEGLGEGYGIENAEIEWEVQEPSIYSQISKENEDVEMERE